MDDRWEGNNAGRAVAFPHAQAAFLCRCVPWAMAVALARLEGAAATAES